MLIVVRHALPACGPEAPPEEWELCYEGQAGAASLTRRLPKNALLVSSTEPKARQTLEPSAPGHPRHALRRGVAARESFGGNFRELRYAYVSGTDHQGWEPRSEVVARFTDTIAQCLDRANGRPLVVASHGMALTTWLTAAVGLPDPAGSGRACGCLTR
ncbi:broad specificity phosphatase PhoE [Allocatelliglobosispora scoriae]|uniref:Broad specificity phosphatase PhoE n=1 Tax=Allocatelliglobosispora scoriae TaxID=643052 RepID=A0A841C634_9ACTN|nr:histidine phosphatase family protein [Allocatelliglobosispora scoriae]MBB5874603.1 broad specificity phosphatase PhoE [Allocatelliglobosispora scoriae]